jgi:hypothetical protein
MVTGASTIPEQMTAYLMGMKQVAFAAVTNPATGYAEGFTHSGEDNLVHAEKAHIGLGKTLFKIIEKFKLSDEPKKLDNSLGHHQKPLRIKHVEKEINFDEVVNKVVAKIEQWSEHTTITNVLWFMSNSLFKEFIEK